MHELQLERAERHSAAIRRKGEDQAATDVKEDEQEEGVEEVGEHRELVRQGNSCEHKSSLRGRKGHQFKDTTNGFRKPVEVRPGQGPRAKSRTQ